jgi:hypothetical protein
MSHHVLGDDGSVISMPSNPTRGECAVHPSAGCCGSSSGSDPEALAARWADLACRGGFSTSKTTGSLYDAKRQLCRLLTIIRTDFQSTHSLRSQTQKIRSAAVSLSRLGADLRKTASCCRKARFSSRSAAEVFNIKTRAPSTVNRTCRAEVRSELRLINLNDYRSIQIFWRDSRC